MLNAFRILFFFLLIGGCGNPPVKQASYSVADYQRPVDSNGYYQFASFRFKGPLHNGNPHGRGYCSSSSYEIPSGPCEFANGVRIDQKYVESVKEEIADEIAYRKEEAKEKAAREYEEDVRRSAEKQRDKERDMQALQYISKNAASLAPSANTNSSIQLYAQVPNTTDTRSQSRTTTSGAANNSQPVSKVGVMQKEPAATNSINQPTTSKVDSKSQQVKKSGGAQDRVESKSLPGKTSPSEKLGPELLEGVAACWQNERNKAHWRCDGPLQDTILSDETLEKQLGYSGCSNPRGDDGTRTIKDKTAKIFLCGYGLGGGKNRDIAQKYGFTVQRNKYQCPASQGKQCSDNYQLTH